MNEIVRRFYAEREERIARMDGLRTRHAPVLTELILNDYEYNFDMLGRPIIQMPQDIIAMQELIWRVQPDLIIETGIAHGGSLMLSAGMLALLDYCDAVRADEPLDPRAGRRRVLGIDIDIRPHNRQAIEAHPLAHAIELLQGSSIAPEIVARVREAAAGHARVLVCLDSNHSHAHVLAELEAYAPCVTRGSYCCVFDTVVEDMPRGSSGDRPWDKGDNPKTAVWEYLRILREHGRQGLDGVSLTFEVDRAIDNKLVFSVAPEGYLRRI